MASQKRRVDRRDSGETERISVTLPIDTKTAITDYAKQLGVTASNVTHHFISVGMAAESIALEGGEVIAHFPNGEQLPVANKRGNFIYRRPLSSTQ